MSEVINWNYLSDRDIIEIIIGDKVIKEIDGHDYRMPYFSGLEIFSFANIFDFELSYEVGPNLSRWKYMKLVIEHCIKNNKINVFFDELLSLKRFKNILNGLESSEIKQIHLELVNAFFKSVNSFLVFEGLVLSCEGNNFSISKIEDIDLSINIGAKEYKDVVTQFCKKIKKENLSTKYGVITDIKVNENQGGNGRVLFGKLNNHEVAIKILYNNTEEKINRFFLEFINVFMSLQKEFGIVEMYLYDYEVFKEQKIHFIIMKKYLNNLNYKAEELNEFYVKKLFLNLCDILTKIHKVGVIHRDIKPENILMDNEFNIVLTDFGIAYFDPDNYEFTGHTVANERLGNREFSAPEQNKKGAVPHPTMDIYSLGQIMQWYVTGNTHIGSGRKNLNDILKSDFGSSLDFIVEKCIRNNPEERYQNMDEIYQDIEKFNIKLDEAKTLYLNKIVINDYGEIVPDGLGRGDKIEII